LSEQLYNKAKKIIPGGVNSPVRFYEPFPFFVSQGNGCKIITCDHLTLVDYCMGYGSLLLGHCNPEIMSTIKMQLEKGTLFCIPTKEEVILAELLTSELSEVEMVRLMNTGSEATMHAIRLSRAFTGKNKIIKFDGCYHGSYEEVLTKAGSGMMESSINIKNTDSKMQTIVLPYNDIEKFEALINSNSDISCVIVEPVPANMGLILPEEDFLNSLRAVTDKNGIVLIFDEIVTGFRLTFGGATEYFGIKPDLVTLGKAIGNGFTLSAVGGKRKILEQLAPRGIVYQGSTYAGNPIATTAGIAVLKYLLKYKSKLYPKLTRLCDSLTIGIQDQVRNSQIDCVISHISSMYQVFFTKHKIRNASDVRSINTNYYKIFFAELLKLGIFVPPSQFETCFISDAHGEDDIDKTIDAYGQAFKKVRAMDKYDI
jgi:glutamate-1-semialdehyde 2,1-aminomutase